MTFRQERTPWDPSARVPEAQIPETQVLKTQAPTTRAPKTQAGRTRDPQAEWSPGKGTAALFVLATVACVAALAATYFFFVRTTTGQFIDESALVEAVAAQRHCGQGRHQAVGLAAGALGGDRVDRGRLRHHPAAPLGSGRDRDCGLRGRQSGHADPARTSLPVRPYRGVETLELNSLPSGHTTMAASAAAAVFLMVSPRWRPLAGFLGGSFAVATGVSTLINQWHRPADVVAAFLVVAVFMLPAGWLIIRKGPRWNVWDGYGAALGLRPAVAGAAAAGGARRGRRGRLLAAERRPRRGPGRQHHHLLLGRDLADRHRGLPRHRGRRLAVRSCGTTHAARCAPAAGNGSRAPKAREPAPGLRGILGWLPETCADVHGFARAGVHGAHVIASG